MEGDESQGSTDQPKFLKNVTAWIGGLTGVVIALAGLRAAYDQFMPDRPAAAAALSNEAQATPTGAEEAPADPAGPETATTLPASYSGDGYTMEWKDGVWVETDSEGKVTNYEQQSRDEDNTFVIDRASNVRWRWPTDGGEVQSFDEEKQQWVDSGVDYAPVAADSPS